MSLHEVRRGSEPIEAYTFSMIAKKKTESTEIDAQVQEFMARGGKAQQIPVGVIAASNYVASEFGSHNAAAQFDQVRENSRKKCIRATMNSKFYPTAQDSVYHSDANRDKFVVIIGKYISKQFDRIDQAVSLRDFRRNCDINKS